jgi:hypothetical protein
VRLYTSDALLVIDVRLMNTSYIFFIRYTLVITFMDVKAI